MDNVEQRRRFRRILMPVMAMLSCAGLAGCGSDDDTPEACAVAVSLDLDAGRYDAALERLDSRACEVGLSAEARELNRAAAWVGRAGYELDDILLAVVAPDAGGDAERVDLRLLDRLSGLGTAQGGVRFLERAALAWDNMVPAFPEGLSEACRDENVPLLSPLQLDACFQSGLFAYARLVRGFDLLLPDQLTRFLAGEPLDCASDRNFSGVPDEVEIASCAISARSRLDTGGGSCVSAGTRAGESTGAVFWSRVGAFPELGFMENGQLFATLVPIRVTVDAGGPCTADGPREAIRMLQPITGATVAEYALTDGFCEVEITRTCSAADPAAGCWPCPIPRVRGTGAVSVTDTLLGPVNIEIAQLLPTLAQDDAARVGGDIAELRESLCAPAEGTPEACESSADGPRLSVDALRRYIRACPGCE